MLKAAILISSAVFCVACTSSAPLIENQAELQSELVSLRQQVAELEPEKKLLSLKLQDEIERSTIQNFLRMREVAAAKQETAALRDQCVAGSDN
tara:strand:- start:17361 stop:17642 length:282 start_codon:yes stop_codon:yes gene_type:complete